MDPIDVTSASSAARGLLNIRKKTMSWAWTSLCGVVIPAECSFALVSWRSPVKSTGGNAHLFAAFSQMRKMFLRSAQTNQQLVSIVNMTIDQFNSQMANSTGKWHCTMSAMKSMADQSCCSAAIAVDMYDAWYTSNLHQSAVCWQHMILSVTVWCAQLVCACFDRALLKACSEAFLASNMCLGSRVLKERAQCHPGSNWQRFATRVFFVTPSPQFR